MISGGINDTGIFRSAIDQLETSVIITDINGIIEYVNPHFCENTGYHSDEVLGNSAHILNSGKQSESYFKKLWQTILSGKTWNGEVQNRRKNGELFWERVSISPIKNEDGGIQRFIAVYQDISKQKESEFRLEREKRLLTTVEEINLTGGWEYDLRTHEAYWTDELFILHGFDKNGVEDYIEKSISCYHPDDQPIIEEAFGKLIEKGETYDLTLRFFDVEGTFRWVRTKSDVLRDESGKIYKVYGSLKDVSDDVLRDQSLNDKEQELRTLISSVDDVIFKLDENLRYTRVFGKWFERFDKSIFLGKTSVEALGEEIGKHHQMHQKKAFSGESTKYIWSSDLEGSSKHYETILNPLFDSHNQVTGVLGIVRDITELIQSQLELRDLKDRYEYAIQGTQAGTWDWNVKTGEVDFNVRWAEMLGYKLEELSPLILKTWGKLTHPDDLKAASEDINKCFRGEIPVYEATVRMKHKEGHWVWINDRGAVFERDEEGNPVRMVGTHIDISDWMRDRKKLEESERRYRTLFEESSDANMIEAESIIIDCNKATVQLLGYDSKDEVIGMHLNDLIPDEQLNGKKMEEEVERIQSILKEHGHFRLESLHIRKNGDIFPVEVMLTSLEDLNNNELRYITWRDISKRKKVEEALIKSNQERGVLLGEIHHRVKNNLAIISGLVQLQMFKSKKKHDVQLLSKTVNRIQSIALMHEQLYQSENFVDISLAKNISKQIEFIHNMYDSEATNIKTELDLDDVQVKIDKAIPVGLLINEILNNAYKYAFEGREEGIINVSLHQSNSKINLIIADNGVGMSKKEYEQKTTLGRTLIDNLILQLDADCNISMVNGVRYHMIFDK